MDALIMAAARSLEAGDPLGALSRIALRDDAHALALRGIAMAQLGDLARARELLHDAAQRFPPGAAVSRARCIVAEAEIALVARDLGWSASRLDRARQALERHGDRHNAAHARYIEARLLLLTGRLDAAESLLARLDPTQLPTALRAAHELVTAGIAMRRRQARLARAALARAREAACQAGIPALRAEVEGLAQALEAPAAYRVDSEGAHPLLLEQVEALEASDTLIVDACRQRASAPHASVSLARRPVLFTLLRALGEAWPEGVPRDDLIARAFRIRPADDSHRVRLRVEIGRLRTELSDLAEILPTPQGFALAPRTTRVTTLVPAIDDRHAGLLALLADGEAWSSSALALASGVSQRTVQRALETLQEAQKVQAHGQGRARRWTILASPGFPTTLLLPASGSAG